MLRFSFQWGRMSHEAQTYLWPQTLFKNKQKKKEPGSALNSDWERPLLSNCWEDREAECSYTLLCVTLYFFFFPLIWLPY